MLPTGMSDRQQSRELGEAGLPDRPDLREDTFNGTGGPEASTSSDGAASVGLSGVATSRGASGIGRVQRSTQAG